MLYPAKSELYRRIGAGNERDIILGGGELRKLAWSRDAPRRGSLIRYQEVGNGLNAQEKVTCILKRSLGAHTGRPAYGSQISALLSS